MDFDRVQEERTRYAELVLNNTASESLLKMPNVATKPRSVDEILELESTPESSSPRQTICKLPSIAPAPFTNFKVSMNTVLTGLSSPSFSSQ
ncbi:hypothetical protein BGZ65_007161, partial [Modicella reniformis]